MLGTPIKSSDTKGYTIKKIAFNLQFTEGAAWHPDGFLLFSDLPANKMYRLFPENGKLDVFINDSGYTGSDHSHLSKMIGSNGIAVDADKNIVFCQHGNHSIAALTTNNEQKLLACLYEGKPFNSPNDLAIKSDGSIYFTDPPYGLKNEKLNPKHFQPHAGVYRLRAGKVELISNTMKFPNGICFSPDEHWMYVSNSDNDAAGITKFELGEDGSVISQELFAEAWADGMCCDAEGNLYICGHNEIDIYAKNGELTDSIELGTRPSNICIGPHPHQLFVTAGDSVFSIVRK